MWSFFRLRLWNIATIASLPWVVEFWIVFDGANPWSFNPTRNNLNDDTLDFSVTVKPPLWLSCLGLIVGGLAMAYPVWFLLWKKSPVRFVLPRFPNLIAVRLSYLHSSSALIDPAPHDINAIFESTLRKHLKYTVGWYGDQDKLQLRVDAWGSCLRRYEPWFPYQNIKKIWQDGLLLQVEDTTATSSTNTYIV